MSESTTQNKVQNKDHVLVYDGIKGLSCLVIMLVHYRFTTVNFPAMLPYIALHAFFVLSAFLITKNLFYEKERINTFGLYIKQFYIKRTLRIFPIYFLYIFLIVGFSAVLYFLHKMPVFLANEWRNFGWLQFTFMSNLREFIAIFKGYDNYVKTAPVFVHLWSVSLEEQFYFFIVFVVFFCNKQVLRVMCIVAIIIFPIIRIFGYYYLLHFSNDELATTLSIAHAPFFQFDVFFYGILPNVFNLRNFKTTYKWMLISLCFLLTWATLNAFYISHQHGISFFEVIREDNYLYRNYGIIFIDSIANFCVLCVVLTASWYPGKLKFITTKFWLVIGMPSYSIYVFQFLFLIFSFFITVFFKRHLPLALAEILGCLLFLVTTVFSSTLLFKFIEVPMFKLKSKFAEKIVAK